MSDNMLKTITSHTWVCDFCSISVTTGESDTLPVGWVWVGAKSPGLCQYCESCAKNVIDWVEIISSRFDPNCTYTSGCKLNYAKNIGFTTTEVTHPNTVFLKGVHAVRLDKENVFLVVRAPVLRDGALFSVQPKTTDNPVLLSL